MSFWASTDVQSDSVTDAGSIAFGRLFGYLSGANENSQTIDMTSPVLNKISPGSALRNRHNEEDWINVVDL